MIKLDAVETFAIGDEVASDICPALIGKIITMPVAGSKCEGLALIRLAEGKNMLISLSAWHKVKK